MSRLRANAELPTWLVELLEAGRELAVLVEEDIQSCGNSPPDCTGCPACKPSREALFRWGCAVWTARTEWTP